MLQQSYVMPKTTPFQNYISNISTDPKSHMLGPYGPHQSFETMKTSPITATFLLHGSAWLHWIKVIPTTTPFHKSISLISSDPKLRILGPLGPHQSPRTTQNTPNSRIIPCMVLHD